MNRVDAIDPKGFFGENGSLVKLSIDTIGLAGRSSTLRHCI